MIDKAVLFINQRVNAYLKAALDITEDKVIPTQLIDQDGKSAIQPNSVGLTMINIEEEIAIQPNRTLVKTNEGELATMNTGLYLNLYLMFAANFNNYNEALKSLSQIIQFFQLNNCFKRDDSPDLETMGIHKLEVRLHKSSLELQNQLWGMLGAKHLPSVIYKTGVIQIQSDQIKGTLTQVETLNTNITSMQV